ncbi:hypothetical protein SRHO_G00295840 [Serrasalmus rhombeus]
MMRVHCPSGTICAKLSSGSSTFGQSTEVLYYEKELVWLGRATITVLNFFCRHASVNWLTSQARESLTT